MRREDFDTVPGLFEEPVAFEHHSDVVQSSRQLIRLGGDALHKLGIVLVDKVAQSSKCTEAGIARVPSDVGVVQSLFVGDRAGFDHAACQVGVLALCDVVHHESVQRAQSVVEDVEDRVEVHVSANQRTQRSSCMLRFVLQDARDEVRQEVLGGPQAVVKLPHLLVVADLRIHHERQAKIVEADVDRIFAAQEVSVVAQVRVADTSIVEPVRKEKHAPSVDQHGLQRGDIKLFGNLLGDVGKPDRCLHGHLARHVQARLCLNDVAHRLGRVVQATQLGHEPRRTVRHVEHRVLFKVGCQERGLPRR